MAKKENKDKEPSFETALDRLETIVAEMESGELCLEKMMAHFEEGQKLVAFCSGKLNEVERKIDILVKKDDGIGTAPFEPEEAEEAEDSEKAEGGDGAP